MKECLGRGQEAESLLFVSEGEERMEPAGCESFLSLTPPDECSREPKLSPVHSPRAEVLSIKGQTSQGFSSGSACRHMKHHSY